MHKIIFITQVPGQIGAAIAWVQSGCSHWDAIIGRVQHNELKTGELKYSLHIDQLLSGVRTAEHQSCQMSRGEGEQRELSPLTGGAPDRRE